MKPDLHVVKLGEPEESIGERIQRLQAEARSLAGQNAYALAGEMAQLATHARGIAEGGDAYSNGVRELARTLADDLESRAVTLRQIMGRTS